MNTKGQYGAMVEMIASLCIVGTIGVFRRLIPLPSALIAFFRGLIGSAMLLVLLLATGKLRGGTVGRRKRLWLLLSGAMIGANWILLFEAFTYTTIPRATLTYYLQPTIVLLLSPLVFRERLTMRTLLCAAVSLAGMVLVSGVIGGADAGTDNLKGIAFSLGAAFLYAMVVISNKLLGVVEPYRKTLYQLAGSAATLLPHLLLTGEFSGVDITPRTALLLLLVGTVHTGLAYLLYIGSMNSLSARTISFLGYIDPVVAMLSSWLVLGEKMSALGILGAVMILGAAIAGESGTASREN